MGGPTRSCGRSSAARLGSSVAEQARRSEVIAAGRAAFYEHGFARTGTRDIARRLGILGGSLYHYIDSKESLLYAVLSEVQAPARSAVGQLQAATGPVVQRFDLLAREHVRATAADPAGIALTFTEISSLKPEHRAVVVDGLRRYRRAVEQLVALGQENGELTGGVNPKLASLVVLGALNWLHRWYRVDGASPPGELASQLASVLLDGMAVEGASMQIPSDAGDADRSAPGPRRAPSTIARGSLTPPPSCSRNTASRRPQRGTSRSAWGCARRASTTTSRASPTCS